MRTDIQGLRAPKELQQHLRTLGGRNPFGENTFRLVFNESRVVADHDYHQDWRPGLSVEDRGGFNFNNDTLQVRRATEKPTRTVLETRMVPLYAHLDRGWTLERWFPASVYGSPVMWEAARAPDGKPLLGPFPEKGDYEHIASWDTLPTVQALREIVTLHIRGVIEKKPGARQRIIEWKIRADARKAEIAKQQYRRDLRRMNRMVLAVTTESSSLLEVGRMRDELAQKAGVTAHYGN